MGFLLLVRALSLSEALSVFKHEAMACAHWRYRYRPTQMPSRPTRVETPWKGKEHMRPFACFYLEDADGWIAVLRNVAVCPDCSCSLNAVANVTMTSGMLGFCHVSMPTLGCRNSRITVRK